MTTAKPADPGCATSKTIFAEARFLRHIGTQSSFDCKARPPSKSGTDAHAVVEQARQAINNGKPKAEPLGSIPSRIGNLIKFLKDTLHVLGWDSNASVVYLDQHPVTASSASKQDAPLVSIPQCILQKVPR